MVEEKRFIADVMLGRLAQYLKFAGYSCVYRREFPDDEILELAGEEQRIILTRDRLLARRGKKVSHSMLVKTTSLPEQLRALKERYNLEFHEDKMFGRCADCDEPLQKVDKQEVIDKIPEQTANWLDEYQQCPKCDKVYWQGSHCRVVRRRFRNWGLLDD